MDVLTETQTQVVKPISLTQALKKYFFEENNPKTGQKFTAVEIKREMDGLTDTDKREFAQMLATELKTSIEWTRAGFEAEIYHPKT